MTKMSDYDAYRLGIAAIVIVIAIGINGYLLALAVDELRAISRLLREGQ